MMIKPLCKYFSDSEKDDIEIIVISKRKIKQICQIYIRYRQSANVESTVNDVKKYLKSEFAGDKDYIIAATNGSHIIGFLHYEKEYSTLRPAYRLVLKAMFVDVEYRKRGIAKKLIQHVQNTAGNCEIRVKARMSNPASPQLYKTNGFCEDTEYVHLVYTSNK